ncbi:MAG: pyruvate formate-lyase, partial [Firmicutes bacterium]|nr:pyruvate formate-lyase [Bacillota bacterium]
MLTERVARMREKCMTTRPSITAERLVLATEAYQKFAGDAVPLFRAKVTNYVMERMSTLILEDELIVGTATNRYKGANLFPEFQSSTQFYLAELDELSTGTKDPYDISPEDKKLILEYLPYWEGKAMQDIARDALPKHTVECMADDIITVGLTNGVSGETTCDHEKLLTVGLKGYIEECRANIEKTMPKCQLDEEKVNFW